jgi:hypothetical protein
MPMSEPPKSAARADRIPLAELANEFAAVRVSLDRTGNGPRLLVEDVESGGSVWLTPLELASFCLATDRDRADWLRVGDYRDERDERDERGRS